MSNLKAIGSEKLKGQDKIKRIMEIARYGETSKNEEYHTHTTSFSKKAANGMVYAIVQEKDGYYVKSGLNESNLEYADGFNNKRKNPKMGFKCATLITGTCFGTFPMPCFQQHLVYPLKCGRVRASDRL